MTDLINVGIALRNLFRYLATALLGAALGVAFTWLLLRPDIPDIWFQITENNQTTLSNQVFLESDIPLADVVSLRGRARVVDHTQKTHGPVSIGYELDIELSRIAPEKIPKNTLLINQ